MNYWTVAPEWRGETVFIVAGGTSVSAHLDADGTLSCLAGRRVIAINSAYQAAPFANLLFFADKRWWEAHRKRLAGFGGAIATTSRAAADPGPGRRLLRLRRVMPPPGLAAAANSVAVRHTSLTAAINLAVHKGAATIVLLGADMGPGPDGRTHHHAPHPWRGTLDHYQKKLQETGMTVAPLKDRGVAVLNASPISRIPWWPKVDLAEALSA